MSENIIDFDAVIPSCSLRIFNGRSEIVLPSKSTFPPTFPLWFSNGRLVSFFLFVSITIFVCWVEKKWSNKFFSALTDLWNGSENIESIPDFLLWFSKRLSVSREVRRRAISGWSLSRQIVVLWGRCANVIACDDDGSSWHLQEKSSCFVELCGHFFLKGTCSTF